MESSNDDRAIFGGRSADYDTIGDPYGDNGAAQRKKGEDDMPKPSWFVGTMTELGWSPVYDTTAIIAGKVAHKQSYKPAEFASVGTVTHWTKNGKRLTQKEAETYARKIAADRRAADSALKRQRETVSDETLFLHWAIQNGMWPCQWEHVSGAIVENDDLWDRFKLKLESLGE